MYRRKTDKISCPEFGRDFLPRFWAGNLARKTDKISCPESGRKTLPVFQRENDGAAHADQPTRAGGTRSSLVDARRAPTGAAVATKGAHLELNNLYGMLRCTWLGGRKLATAIFIKYALYCISSTGVCSHARMVAMRQLNFLRRLNTRILAFADATLPH